MEDNLTPIIDWSSALKLAGNKPEIAEEIFNFFIKQLPIDYHLIKLSYQNQKYDLLKDQVHKLHGALCYCGLPRLKFIVAKLESELKNHIIKNLPSLITTLDKEVSQLLKHTRNNAINSSHPTINQITL